MTIEQYTEKYFDYIYIYIEKTKKFENHDFPKKLIPKNLVHPIIHKMTFTSHHITTKPINTQTHKL